MMKKAHAVPGSLPAEGTGAKMAKRAPPRRKVDEELRKSHEKLEAALNALPDMMFELDRDGIFRDYRAHNKDELYMPPEVFVGKSFREVLPLTVQHLVEEALRDAEERGIHRGTTYCLEVPGGLLWFELSIACTGAPGAPDQRFIVLARNITGRRNAEEALRRSEALYRSILAASPDDITITDLEGVIRMVSPSALVMLGFDREEELVGRKILDFLVPEDRDRASANVTLMYKGVYTGPGAYRVLRAGGSPLDIEANAEFIRDGDGNPAGMVFIVRDISERTRADEQIKGLLSEKELLLKEVHHRVKNNISTVMGLLALQSNRLKDPAAVDALKDARNRMQSMEALYDKLYRTEGFREISIQDYILPLLEEIVSIFPHKDMVKIESELSDFPLSARILSPLGIILNELVTNAMKYAFTGREAGVIKVSASLRDNRVTLVFQDNGHGIPGPDIVEKSGGFGMELIYSLTEQLGGTVRMESNEGTAFILEFDA